VKLTKQGVRDLGSAPKKPKAQVPPNCEHKRMKECHKGCGHYHCPDCHKGCGHYHCPDCGLSWDTYAEA